MAGANLSISINYDDRVVIRTLRRLMRSGKDMHVVFADIGEYLLQSTEHRFDTEQAPDGTSWEPLSESTIRRKMLKGVRRGKGQKRRSLTTSKGNTKIGAIRSLAAMKILVDSGNLRDTLRYQASWDSLRVGSDRVYAASMQFGDDDRSIPARPFLGLSDEDRREVIEILKDHMRQAIH